MKDKKRGERAAPPPPPPPPPGRGSIRPVRKGADKEEADKELADEERADKEGADKELADEEGADKEGADKEGADKEGAGKEGRPEAVPAPDSSSAVETGHRDGEVRVEEPEGRGARPPREATRWTLGRSRRGIPERDQLPVANPIDTSAVPVADLFQANGNTEMSEEALKRRRQRQRERAVLRVALLLVAATMAIGLGVGLTRPQPPAPTTPPSPQSPAPSTSRPTTPPTPPPTSSANPSASPTLGYCSRAYGEFNDCLGYSGNGTSECEGCIRAYYLNRQGVDLSSFLTIVCTQVDNETCEAITVCSPLCVGCTQHVMPFVACESVCDLLLDYNCTGEPPYGP